MLRSVFAKTLDDARRAILWWSLGLIAMSALMVAVYPTIRHNPQLNKLVQSYPEALKAFIAFGGSVDYASGAGYLGSELFSFMVPLLLLIAAIGAGARATAGEEERGTLDLLLANPISRFQLLTEKMAALVAEVSVLTVVLWFALLVGDEFAGLGVSAPHLLAATAAAGLLAVAFGAIAALAGALSGHRGIAAGVPAAGAVAAYLISSLAAIVKSLQPFRQASPFYHYVASDPLHRGLELGHTAFLVGLTLLAMLAALIAFDRRDLAA